MATRAELAAQRAGLCRVRHGGRSRRALAGLGVDAPLPALIDAVRPVLGVWWPQHPVQAAALAHAVERLRIAAVQRPSLVGDARYVMGRD